MLGNDRGELRSNRPPCGRIRGDPYPRIRPAGWIPFGTEDDVDQCVRSDVYTAQQRPSTPEHLKKYRKSVQGQPAIRQVHFGLYDDVPEVDYQYKFGKKTQFGDPLETVIKAQNLNGLADKFNDIREQQYASSKREPLGNSYQRVYEWPKETQTDGFKFGVPSGRQINAKDLLYPQGGSLEEKPAVQKMYEKTHSAVPAGVQRKRDYQWTVDPVSHQFGYSEPKLLNGVQRSVQPERYDEAFPKTVIVKREVEDMKSCTQDQLGKVKNLGQGFHPLPEHHTYGKGRDMEGEWNAAKCLQGEPSDRELLPDSDLGVCVKIGSRNVPRTEADMHRAFGCPTIRTDIPGRKQKSVADYQNYGDEKEAIDLLFPATHTEIGIDENDFAKPKTRSEIRSLFANIGYSYRQGKFNALYNRALDMMPIDAPVDMVSIRAFMTAVQQLHDVQ